MLGRGSDAKMARWNSGITMLETIIVLGLGGVVIFGLVLALRAGGTFTKNAQDASQLKRDAAISFLSIQKRLRNRDLSTVQISGSTLYLDRGTASEKCFMKQGNSLVYSEGSKIVTLAHQSISSVQFAFLSGDKVDGTSGNNRLQVTLQLAKGKCALTETTIVNLRNVASGASYTVEGTGT
jgi:hypothetical protein